MTEFDLGKLTKIFAKLIIRKIILFESICSKTRIDEIKWQTNKKGLPGICTIKNGYIFADVKEEIGDIVLNSGTFNYYLTWEIADFVTFVHSLGGQVIRQLVITVERSNDDIILIIKAEYNDDTTEPEYRVH